MKVNYTDVAFDPGEEFQFPVRFEREATAQKFALLKDDLLSDWIDEAEALTLHERLKHVANEAAGLAWTTEYPMLVFPALFDEMARRERVRELRQQRIIARTENLLEAIV